MEDRIKELETINEEHREINGELRNRINKVIEYIKGDLEINEKYKKEQEEPLYSKAWLIDTYSDLLNILQGSDE